MKNGDFYLIWVCVFRRVDFIAVLDRSVDVVQLVDEDRQNLLMMTEFLQHFDAFFEIFWNALIKVGM